MNRTGSIIGWIPRPLVLSMACSWPGAGWSTVLQSLDIYPLADHGLEMVLTFDEPPPEPLTHSSHSPARIALDFPNTSSVISKYNELQHAWANSITVVQAGDRTRMVVSLDHPTVYDVRIEGAKLFLHVGEHVPGERTKTHNTIAPATSLAPYAYSGPNDTSSGLTGVDFRRGKQGEGVILIGLLPGTPPADISDSGDTITLTFPGAELPDALDNRLDVTDFGTIVDFVDVRRDNGNVEITIHSQNAFDYQVVPGEQALTVSVSELVQTADEDDESTQATFTGDGLSLNFQDIEVRDVLQILADFKELNLVASDTVTGRVTLRLKDVPWDQALDIVLRARGLGQRRENNVLIVAPAAELSRLEREQLESQKQFKELAPLYTDLIQVNYADAAEISTVLLGDKDNRILSDRGSIQVIGRTNSLLIQETQEKLDEIRHLIKNVDIPVRQVQIEARIVNADTSFRKELGVRWGGYINSGSRSSGGEPRVRLGGQGASISTSEVQEEGGSSLQYDYDYNQLFTDLSVSGSGAGALALGFLTDSAVLNLELSALESDGGGEIVSQPKVITSDKQKAVIKSGKEIPFQEASSSGATSVSFKDAVLSLEVTPQITPDGRVIMDIKITNNDSTTSTSTGIPIIDTNEVETKVLINDGQTIVLGGIFTNTTSQGVDKVPLLADIPGLGRLFRRKTKRDSKSEVLIFITPKILTEPLALR